MVRARQIENGNKVLLKARLRANLVHLPLHDDHNFSYSEQGQCEKQLLYSRTKKVNWLRRSQSRDK